MEQKSASCSGLAVVFLDSALRSCRGFEVVDALMAVILGPFWSRRRLPTLRSRLIMTYFTDFAVVMALQLTGIAVISYDYLMTLKSKRHFDAFIAAILVNLVFLDDPARSKF